MNDNLGISTVWQSKKPQSAYEFVRGLTATGIRKLELEYRVTEEMLNKILPVIRSEQVEILSIHNFFPAPVINGISSPGGDAFPLSSPNSAKRKEAVEATLKTVAYASKLGAKAVDLHLGSIEMDDYKETFRKYYKEGKIGSDEWKIFFNEVKKNRSQLSPYYLESALRSIEEIASYLPVEVKIGIENRNYFHQVPDFTELKTILGNFPDSRIGYWHDCGHAQVQENMNWSKVSSWFSEFSHRLLGVHLHDCYG